MKKIPKTILQVLLIIVIVFSCFGTVHAFNEPYTMLAPLPGVSTTNGQTTFTNYISNFLNLAIGIGAVMAFVMITFGGVIYATSDAISGKQDGRNYIENALWGLLLVIGAYVILYTINPQILTLTLSPATPLRASSTPAVYVSVPCCTRTGNVLNGYTLTQAQVAENTALVERLRRANIFVNNNGRPCASGATSGCTNIVGLPEQTIERLTALRTACGNGCLVTITGGTEGGHVEHGPDLPVVDLSPSATLNSYFAVIEPDALNPRSGTVVRLEGGGTATYENTGDNGRASAPHWHVEY